MSKDKNITFFFLCFSFDSTKHTNLTYLCTKENKITALPYGKATQKPKQNITLANVLSNRKKKKGSSQGIITAPKHSAKIILSNYCFLPTDSNSIHLYSRIMLFSGAKPTQALIMFSNIARCFDNAFTTGVPGGTKGALVK